MTACGDADGSWWIRIWGLVDWLERDAYMHMRGCVCVLGQRRVLGALFHLSQYSFETGSLTECRDGW